jgi:hypothetical protein
VGDGPGQGCRGLPRLRGRADRLREHVPRHRGQGGGRRAPRRASSAARSASAILNVLKTHEGYVRFDE